jgi:type I restriction enzyme S subunit
VTTQNLPVGWRSVKLEEVAASEKGAIVSGPFGSNIGKRFFVDEGVPVIRGNNLRFGDSRFIDEGFVFITEEKAHELRNCSALPDDLIFTAAGTLGQVGLIPKQPHFSRYIISNKQLRLRCDRTISSPTYLYYWFSSPEMRTHIANQNTGASVPLITLGTLRNLPLNLPPLNVQCRIADILSAYDDLIENNTRRMKILEQMAQMLYREWFVNFRFPGHEKVKLVESEMGLIPQGWTASELGKLCGEVRRSVNPSDVPTKTPYIGLEHMPRKSIALSEWGEAGQVQSTKLRFQRGEILFGKIRPYFHKVGIAPVDGVCSSDAIVIVPNSVELFPMLLQCVSSDDFVLQATQTSQGTKMPRANWNVLCRYAVALPERPLLDRFNAAILPTVELINNLLFRNRNLRTTRDMLLPKLVCGEVSVENLEKEAVAQMV